MSCPPEDENKLRGGSPGEAGGYCADQLQFVAYMDTVLKQQKRDRTML